MKRDLDLGDQIVDPAAGIILIPVPLRQIKSRTYRGDPTECEKAITTSPGVILQPGPSSQHLVILGRNISQRIPRTNVSHAERQILLMIEDKTNIHSDLILSHALPTQVYHSFSDWR